MIREQTFESVQIFGMLEEEIGLIKAYLLHREDHHFIVRCDSDRSFKIRDERAKTKANANSRIIPSDPFC
jgi:hypothetical protein